MYCTTMGSSPSFSLSTCFEGCLVALTLVLAAHQQRRRAARVEADFGEFLPRPGCFFDRVGEADPAQFAANLRLVAPFGEAGPVGFRESLLLVGGEVAAIVVEAEGGLDRQPLGWDQVPGAQHGAVKAKFARRVVDQSLDDVGRLGAPGAAIRRGAVCVRHHRIDSDVGGRDVVGADQGADIAKRREQVALRGDIGPDIGERLDAQAEELAVLVERQLGVGDVVARVLVGLDALAALTGPFDRPP
jgi:hypothetical protein